MIYYYSNYNEDKYYNIIMLIQIILITFFSIPALIY